MNLDWVLLQLREALEELSRTIAAIEVDPNYDVGELLVAMQHLYHHLNTVWNSRDQGLDRVKASTDKDFYTCRSFPRDIYFGR